MNLTNREYFAAMAMQGLLADHKDHEDERQRHYEYQDDWDSGCLTSVKLIDPETGKPGFRKRIYDETCEQAVARIAVEHADALIEALNKK